MTRETQIKGLPDLPNYVYIYTFFKVHRALGTMRQRSSEQRNDSVTINEFLYGFWHPVK